MAKLASGVASLSVSGLVLGDHDIVAADSGDENFPASALEPPEPFQSLANRLPFTDRLPPSLLLQRGAL